MKRTNELKHFAYAFLIALIGYFAFYACDAHLRQRHGPWRVTFAKDDEGNPSLVINDPRLNITGVRIVFVGERAALTNAPAEVVFDRPLQPVPFGKVIFEELMWLPGTVTLDLFGHEVQLLPRVLTINRKEFAWRTGAEFRLTATDKLPPEMLRPPKR
ncbi:MAG: hypothetical protein HY043_07025 [Verrucomicrobia bacterium]|nr:hypothetical protein [Verrucomicrobiota bacterium]